MTTQAASSTASEAQRRLVDDAVDALLDWASAQPGLDSQAFLERRYELGLARVDNPVGLGGLDVPADLQEGVERQLIGRGPALRYQVHAQWGMYNAAFNRYATVEQRQRWLPPLFTSEARWCVLLSEPNAGSDLASVATRAERQDDVWVVNGQKVWTSLAQVSDFGLLLARHDPAIRGHAGLTAFVVDMSSSGVEVRPLRQMTGDAEFNEVFLTDVVIPDRDRVGEVGGGWPIVMLTLSGERQVIADEGADEETDPIYEVINMWNGMSLHDDLLRDRLARLWLDSEAIRLFSAKVHQDPASTMGASIAKIAYTAYLQRVFELAVDLLGPHGALYPDDYEFKVLDVMGFEGMDARRNFLAARGRTIGGGTTQVLLNVLSERVLGLPREPRPAPSAPAR